MENVQQTKNVCHKPAKPTGGDMTLILKAILISKKPQEKAIVDALIRQNVHTIFFKTCLVKLKCERLKKVKVKGYRLSNMVCRECATNQKS